MHNTICDHDINSYASKEINTQNVVCFVENECMITAKYDKNGMESHTIICEGYAYIDRVVESIGDNINKMILRVKPLHGVESEIEIDAKDLADNRKIRGILCNVFGTDDLSTLKVEHIKAISDHPAKVVKLFKKPQWYNNKIIAPGLGNADNQFKFEKNVVVDFNTIGNYQLGIEALENIIKGFNPKHAIIGIAVFMGAPVIGKLWDGDRFGLFLQATTGFMKTVFINLVAPLYGQGYGMEGNLLRWGQGTTANAAAHVAALSGPFPFILDNYKAYGPKDASEITRLIHGILEGAERAGMKHNENKLRESEPYLCTPIFTGENYPGNDAATRARIILLKWEKPRDLDAITDAQKHIADINVLGKQWVLWLSSEEGQLMLEFIADNFDLKRTEYLKKAKDSVNAGRIATNAAILSLIWELMKFCPYTRDFAFKYDEEMQQAINDHILEASDEVNSNTEAEKFISWFKAALETNQFFISGLSKSDLQVAQYAEAQKAATKTHIGICKENEIWITPEVFNNILLPAYLKTNDGVRVDKISLRRQLHERNFILYDEKNKKYTLSRYMDQKVKKVMVFKKEMLYPEG
jgi:hypothetical protein